MTKLLCLFLIFVSFRVSAQNNSQPTLTPPIFKQFLQKLKKANYKFDLSELEEYQPAVGPDGETALAYLMGCFQRRAGLLDEADKNFHSVQNALLPDIQQSKFKSAYAYTVQDLDKEILLLRQGQYMAKPVVDKKVVESSLKTNKLLSLEFYNGRAYAGDDSDRIHYRVDSIAKFCSLVRSIYPVKIYPFGGKKLRIEFLKASYGSKVIYDHCNQSMASRYSVEKERLNNSDLDGTTGWSWRIFASPISITGPLFSYYEFDEYVESQVSWSRQVHTYDLSRLKPAKFADWFEPNSLNLPCPKDQRDIEESGSLHCAPSAKIKYDQFSIAAFNADFSSANLKILVESVLGGSADHYTQSKGTATSNDSLRKILKATSQKDFLFDAAEK